MFIIADDLYSLDARVFERFSHLTPPRFLHGPKPSDVTPLFSGKPFEVIQGNSKRVLRQLADSGIIAHTVLTSPPYFFKRRYGACSDELGRETDVVDYIAGLVDVFSTISLHPRGSIWVNIADTRGPGGQLLCVPERFVIAMSLAGFLPVDSVVWAKCAAQDDGSTIGGMMPDPAKSRLNGNAYECLYRFVKTQTASDAWTDICSIAIPRQGIEDRRYLPRDLMTVHTSVVGRGIPNVWLIGPGKTRRKHWAVFPERICERPIAMSCPMWVCNDTGDPSERLVEMVEYNEGRSGKRLIGKYRLNESKTMSGRQDSGRRYVPRYPKTIGWTHDPDNCTPGIVLDPFAGTGTTGAVAIKMGRRFIGVELYEDNCRTANDRLSTVWSGITVNPRHLCK